MADREALKQDAQGILSRIHASKTQDFHTLTSEQVDQLLVEADIRRYQKPKNANGSRARCFFSLIQRRAVAS